MDNSLILIASVIAIVFLVIKYQSIETRFERLNSQKPSFVERPVEDIETNHVEPQQQQQASSLAVPHRKLNQLGSTDQRGRGDMGDLETETPAVPLSSMFGGNEDLDLDTDMRERFAAEVIKTNGRKSTKRGGRD